MWVPGTRTPPPDRGREGLTPSPPSEPCVRFSRTRLSSRWFPHRDWLTNRWVPVSVKNPTAAEDACAYLRRRYPAPPTWLSVQIVRSTHSLRGLAGQARLSPLRGIRDPLHTHSHPPDFTHPPSCLPSLGRVYVAPAFRSRRHNAHQSRSFLLFPPGFPAVPHDRKLVPCLTATHGTVKALTPAPRHPGQQVSPLLSHSLPDVPSPTTEGTRMSLSTPIPAHSMHFRLHLLLAGSPSRTAESSSSSYGPPVRLRLLSTPPHDDAVTFDYGVLAYPDTDSHRAENAPPRAH